MRIPYRVRNLLRKSYTGSTLLQHAQYYVDPVYRRNPLIVYQMGKVGSEALEASLLECGIERPIYRVHAMVPDNIVRGFRGMSTTPREYYKRSRTDFYGYHLGREIARDLHRRQWQVITMVRDPVAQNVSSFFQILDMLVPDYQERLARDAISIEELTAVFVRNYPPDSIFIRWFEAELGRTFEIDVYAHPFPWEQGFQRITEPHVDLLIVRLEDFERIGVKAVSDFLGIPQFSLVRKNVGSDKAYNALYERFKAEAVLPSSYVEGVYASRYARHFYSDEERARFRSRLNVG